MIASNCSREGTCLRVGTGGDTNTKAEYFDFERQYQGWLDRFYQARGWRVRRVSGAANRYYDLTLDGVPCEEKAQRERWDAMVVEFWQDYPSREKGWAAHIQAERLIWIDGWLDDQPYLVMLVDWPRLKQWMRDHHKAYEMLTSRRGYGETKFKKVPWSHIVDMTTRLYDRQKQEEKEAMETERSGENACQGCGLEKQEHETVCELCRVANEGWGDAG